VYSTLNYDHGPYSVTVTAPDGSEDTFSKSFNASTRWVVFEAITYWQAGLNQSTMYSVTLQNNVDSGTFSLGKVVTMGAMPALQHALSTYPTQTPSLGSSGSHSISNGVIAGIAVSLTTCLAS
jgi:hypothetical protein